MNYSATRKCMNALDTIDHAERKGNPKRVKLMRYYLEKYGYDERRNEERGYITGRLNEVFNSLNTYRK